MAKLRVHAFSISLDGYGDSFRSLMPLTGSRRG